MNWQDQIDKIVVINLPERQDRRIEIESHFSEHDIQFSFYPAIKDDVGWKGLLQTMKKLFEENQERKNILVYEDDACFLYDPNGVMENSLSRLPENYLTFQLGYNLMGKPFKIDENILKITSSYATHAVLYSNEGMRAILDCYDESLPYDVMLLQRIQPLGRSFGIYPVLCSQRTGYSSIENQEKDWGALMSITYRMFTHGIV